MMKDPKGFTLLELVVVIVLVGILSSLALPKLYSVVERSRMAEAYAAITTIRSGTERYYLMNNGSYTGLNIGFGADPCAENWQLIGIGNPSCAPNSHFKYRVNGTTLIVPVQPGYYIGVTRNSHECNNCPTYNQEFFIIVPQSGTISYCGYGYYASVLGACT